MAIENYKDLLFNLLPRGIAWPGGEHSKVAALLLALASELQRVDDRVFALLTEAYPGTAFELLDDWERICGLPEPCTGAPTTIKARRDAVLEKLSRVGGQSRAFFINIASIVGYDVTITEFRPFLCGINTSGDACYSEEWRFVWQVNAPEVTVYPFYSGGNSSGDRLRSWGNELLECIINRLKPAHTHVIFAYGE